MNSSQSDVALDQFLMRLGYTHDTDLNEIAEEVERLREDNARLKRFVRLTASGGQWPNA